MSTEGMNQGKRNSKPRFRVIVLATTIAVALILVGLILLSDHLRTTPFPSSSSRSSTSDTQQPGGPASAAYITSSAPDSSQWLVVKSSSSPASVLANNTGKIQMYSSLSLLNQTKIGEFCKSTSSAGTCLLFQMYSQTGWYWDSQDQILYIHYVGARAVKITVFLSKS